MNESSLSAVIRAVLFAVFAATVLMILASFLLAPEGEPRMQYAIGICAWFTAILLAWRDFRARAKTVDNHSSIRSGQFSLRRLFLWATVAAVAIWFGREVRLMWWRREVLEIFQSRGGSAELDPTRGQFFIRAFVVPKDEFSAEELNELQAAYPNAAIEPQRPPVWRTDAMGK